MAIRSKKTDASRDGDDRSTVRLLKDIGDNTTTLVKKELELFKLELLEAVSARLKAAGAIAFAGVLVLFVVAFLGAAAAWALSNVMPMWAANLVVAGGFLLLAMAGLMFAKRRMKVPSMKPEETVRTVKEDVEWAKEQLKR